MHRCFSYHLPLLLFPELIFPIPLHSIFAPSSFGFPFVILILATDPSNSLIIQYLNVFKLDANFTQSSQLLFPLKISSFSSLHNLFSSRFTSLFSQLHFLTHFFSLLPLSFDNKCCAIILTSSLHYYHMLHTLQIMPLKQVLFFLYYSIINNKCQSELPLYVYLNHLLWLSLFLCFQPL